MSNQNIIFVVDDDPITRFGLKKVLIRDLVNVTISEFKNGKLALVAFQHIVEAKEALPNTIFLDINMPVMDGWEFLEAFIELPIAEALTINILTSSIDPADRQKFEYFKNVCKHELVFMNKPLLKLAQT